MGTIDRPASDKRHNDLVHWKKFARAYPKLAHEIINVTYTKMEGVTRISMTIDGLPQINGAYQTEVSALCAMLDELKLD